MAVGNNISEKCKGCYRLMNHDFICDTCVDQNQYISGKHWNDIRKELEMLDKNRRKFVYKDITDATLMAKRYLNSIYGSNAFKTAVNRRFEIKKVIFNNPATIVLWEDGTKTVVKCQDGDLYDAEKGLAMAISRKAFGNKHNYFNVFEKWIKRYNKNKEKEDSNE